VLLVAAIGTSFAFNWCYQICRKPSEIVGLLDSRYYKNPKQTWATYAGDFEQYATPLMSAELLAALAQTETRGNTIARTYWKWNFNAKNPLGFYAPASSAVGLMQITDGTFAVAKHFCVRDGQVLTENSKPKSCYFNDLHNRLIPGHSIEMTSAYLQVNVLNILKEKKISKKHRVTLKQKQELAAVIHLCGPKRGEVFARRQFRFSKGERCGAYEVPKYVAQVEKLENSFYLISGHERPREVKMATAKKRHKRLVSQVRT
jgi:hypothetical protein